MESITTDIQRFFDSLDAFDGEHFTGEAFTSVADSVGCCRIRGARFCISIRNAGAGLCKCSCTAAVSI